MWYVCNLAIFDAAEESRTNGYYHDVTIATTISKLPRRIQTTTRLYALIYPSLRPGSQIRVSCAYLTPSRVGAHCLRLEPIWLAIRK